VPRLFSFWLRSLLPGLVVVGLTAGCAGRPARTAATPDEGLARQHSPYDDSTLARGRLPVLLPYNRIIAPAGRVVAFGNPDLENHALDLRPVPDSPLLAVEDRFGVALLDTAARAVVARWTYADDPRYKGFMSTYSGLKVLREGDQTRLYWSAANGQSHQSLVLEAEVVANKISLRRTFAFALEGAPLALPNDLALTLEAGRRCLYVALNGNNQLVKLDLATGERIWTRPTGVAPFGVAVAGGRVFVSNWAGPVPLDTLGREVAGVPYGHAYVEPRTGATAQGTVSVFGQAEGQVLGEVAVGLHPNAVLASPDEQFIYVANGNSDAVSVLDATTLLVRETIAVGLLPGPESFGGSSPNALALSADGTTLYVANGLDNAVAVVALGAGSARGGPAGPSVVRGFIPTEAYPGGLALTGNILCVANLEGEGARASSAAIRAAGGTPDALVRQGAPAYNAHHQLATVSLIALPSAARLAAYSEQVQQLALSFRQALARARPRPGVAPQPMPARIGEPSVFQHVVYIIKENRTYDQVLGDVPSGRGAPALCVFGDSITPNQHALAREFALLDNYHASGKSSAEGHQWTDAGQVSDYVEKSVRAWFRSYPHVQEDALVYSAPGFIWNHAADHGRSVRIYGEACKPHYAGTPTWNDFYQQHLAGRPPVFTNTSTIARVRPLLSPRYPGSDDLRIPDQVRADAFIQELAGFEKQPGEALPELSVIALSADHTVGTRPGYPTPRAMVADNDLALGRMLAALSKSRFWKNTVVFVTEDDSQAGWDHISAYRTTGFVVSPYSRLGRTVTRNYNQTSMLRSIEQILGLPPLSSLDATALPMFDCFTDKPDMRPFRALPARIRLARLNPKLSSLRGPARYYARLSAGAEFDHVDGGRDEVLNRILWFSTKGRQPYPAALTGED